MKKEGMKKERIFLNESSPPKTPCEHHVHGHGHDGSPVKNL